MTVCESPDFMFPMQASVYHPIIEQGDFGAIKSTGYLTESLPVVFLQEDQRLKKK